MRRCRSCSPRPKRCCPPMKCSCTCSPDCCVPSRRARSFSPIKRYVSCPPCDPSDPCDPCYPINCPRRRCKTYPSSILCDPCCPPRKAKCYLPYDVCDPCYPKKGKCYPCFPRGVDSYIDRKCDPYDPCYSFRPKRCDPCDPCVPKKCLPCDPCKPRRCDPWDPCDPCEPCVPRRRDPCDPYDPCFPCDPCLPWRRKPCYPCEPCYPRKIGPCDPCDPCYPRKIDPCDPCDPCYPRKIGPCDPCDPCLPRRRDPCDPCVPRRRYPCDPCYPRRRDPCDPCSPCDSIDPCYPRRRKPCYPCGPRKCDPCDPRRRVPCDPCDPYYLRWRDACDPCFPRIRDPCEPRRRYPCDPCEPCGPYPPTRCSRKCDDFFRSRCPVCLQIKCICLKSCSADDCKDSCAPLSCDAFNKVCYPCGDTIRVGQDTACCPVTTSSGEAVCQETRVGTDDRCSVDGPSKEFLEKSRCLGKCMSRYQPHFCPWEADISVSGTIRAHCNSTAVEVAKRMTGRFKSDGERYTTDSCAKLPSNRHESQQMSLGVLDDGTNLDFSRNNRKLSDKQKTKDTIVLTAHVNGSAKTLEKDKSSASDPARSSSQKTKRKNSKILPLPFPESDDADARSESLEGGDRFYETSVSHDGGVVRKKVDLDLDRKARGRSERVRRILEAQSCREKDVGRDEENFVARRSPDKAGPSKNKSCYHSRRESPDSAELECERKQMANSRYHKDEQDGDCEDVSEDIKNFLRLRKRHWRHSSRQRKGATLDRSPSNEQDNTPPDGVCSRDAAGQGRWRRKAATIGNREVSSDESQTVISTRRQQTTSHPEGDDREIRTVFRKVPEEKHSHCRSHRR